MVKAEIVPLEEIQGESWREQGVVADQCQTDPGQLYTRSAPWSASSRGSSLSSCPLRPHFGGEVVGEKAPAVPRALEVFQGRLSCAPVAGLVVVMLQPPVTGAVGLCQVPFFHSDS